MLISERKKGYEKSPTVSQPTLFPDLVEEVKSFKGKKIKPPPKEELEQLLDRFYGNMRKVAQSYVLPNGENVDSRTVQVWLADYGISSMPYVKKVEVARTAFHEIYDQAINGKNLKACMYILDKWGKYIDFVEEKKEISISHKGDPWDEIVTTIDPNREKVEEAQVEVLC